MNSFKSSPSCVKKSFFGNAAKVKAFSRKLVCFGVKAKESPILKQIFRRCFLKDRKRGNICLSFVREYVEVLSSGTGVPSQTSCSKFLHLF